MDFAPKDRAIVTGLCICSRLYFLSILTVGLVLLGDVCSVEFWSGYNHQAIGAMMVAGGVWLTAVVVYALVTADVDQPVESYNQITSR